MLEFFITYVIYTYFLFYTIYFGHFNCIIIYMYIVLVFYYIQITALQLFANRLIAS